MILKKSSGLKDSLFVWSLTFQNCHCLADLPEIHQILISLESHIKLMLWWGSMSTQFLVSQKLFISIKSQKVIFKNSFLEICKKNFNIICKGIKVKKKDQWLLLRHINKNCKSHLHLHMIMYTHKQIWSPHPLLDISMYWESQLVSRPQHTMISPCLTSSWENHSCLDVVWWMDSH